MLQKMLDYCKTNGIQSEEANYNYILYLELCEVKKYWDVSWSCKNGVLYCNARKSKESPLLTFIPFPMTKKLTINLIEKLQASFETKMIILVIQHSDSSSLYYELTEGLVKKTDETSLPDGPTDIFIRNNKKLLYTKALNGT